MYFSSRRHDSGKVLFRKTTCQSDIGSLKRTKLSPVRMNTVKAENREPSNDQPWYQTIPGRFKNWLWSFATKKLLIETGFFILYLALCLYLMLKLSEENVIVMPIDFDQIFGHDEGLILGSGDGHIVVENE